jgi:hypothetical protein
MEDSAFPKLEMLPEALKWLCIMRGEHFGKLSAKYNNILSIGSTGVENTKGGGYEKIVGDHALKMNGRSYHYLSNSSRKMSGINYFTFDGFEDAQRHLGILNDRVSGEQRARDKILELSILTSIFNELKETNEFVQELQWIGKGLTRTLRQLNSPLVPDETAVRQITASLNVQTSLMEVGCILSDESQGNIVYKFNVKNMGHTINSASDIVEPLCYVLLFPFGERGWCRDLSKRVGFMQYMCSRFKMPERTFYSDFDPKSNSELELAVDNPHGLLRQWNKDRSKLLATNRFQLMTRLSQYYQVEQLSRALDFRLQFHKKQQGYIFGERSQYGSNTAEDEEEVAIQERGDDDNNIGEETADHNTGEEGAANSSSSRAPQKSFLGSSFNGSPRHLNELAHNALTIVTELGSPDVFITGTCNPMWPEIQERLFPGQTAFDRPDVVAEVVHSRIEALVHNLRNGKYFGGRKTAYDIRVTEYQHRGLPHFHLVCKLQNMPAREDTDGIKAFIDEYVYPNLTIIVVQK